MPDMHAIRVGTAGWAIPSGLRAAFPEAVSGLGRYASRLPAVEVDSSFHRPHRRETYARWASEAPDGFLFSVKVPREITHVGRLTDIGLLDSFLDQVGGLGEKLGTLLIQLPPSLAFQQHDHAVFFRALRGRFSGDVVCEPRHGSWLQPCANETLSELRVSRVAADPAPSPGLDVPGGWPGLVYFRMHGSPRRYYSPYAAARLAELAETLVRSAAACPVWCIFDNTAAGAALGNALTTTEEVQRRRPRVGDENGRHPEQAPA
jgi:uncharacterized protein YecE (DUF72 family)